MVDGVQVAFPHDHELVFERLLFRNALCPECLVLDFQQVLYSGVFVHRCNRPKVKVFMGVLDLHMNDCPIVL